MVKLESSCFLYPFPRLFQADDDGSSGVALSFRRRAKRYRKKCRKSCGLSALSSDGTSLHAPLVARLCVSNPHSLQEARSMSDSTPRPSTDQGEYIFTSSLLTLAAALEERNKMRSTRVKLTSRVSFLPSPSLFFSSACRVCPPSPQERRGCPRRCSS